jgi:hypothetical protein
MNASDYAILITAVAGLVSATLSGLAAIYAAKAKALGQENAKAIQHVEHATNSMKDALVAAAGKAGFLEGQEAQKKKSPPYPRE